VQLAKFFGLVRLAGAHQMASAPSVSAAPIPRIERIATALLKLRPLP